MPELIDRRTFIWPDSGIEPDPNDAVYVPRDQPIAQYDNFINWAITEDIKALSESFGDHSDTHEEGGSDEINLDGLSIGKNRERVITETETPANVTFTASETIDLHLRTDVTLVNSGTAGESGTIRATLYQGTDNSGTALVTEEQSVTVAAGEQVTRTLLQILNDDDTQSGLQLNDAEHHLSVVLTGFSNVAVTSTAESTYGGEWTLWERDGDLAIEDHWGRTVFGVDGVTGKVTDLPTLATLLRLDDGLSMTGGTLDLQSSPLSGKGEQIWNPTEKVVNQPRLGGPAGKFQHGYPLDGRDMKTGEESHIDAEYLQGYEPEDFFDGSGEWTHLDQFILVDTDDSSPITWDTGVMNTTYDIYRLDIYVEDHRSPAEDPDAHDATQVALSMRLNNHSGDDYTYDIYDSSSNYNYSREELSGYDNRSIGHIATTIEGGVAHHQLVVKCPQPINAPANHFPLVGTVDDAPVVEECQMMTMGVLERSIGSINRLSLTGTADATGRITLSARNLREPPSGA